MMADTAIHAIQQLYKQVPALTCQGRCRHACISGINASDAERDHIAATTGIQLPIASTPGAKCAALGVFGTCMVYEVRPMICRLWGATTVFLCPYGCIPPDGYLDDTQMINLMLATLEIGGGMDATEVAEVRRFIALEPAATSLLARVIRAEPGGAAELTALATRHHRQRRQHPDTH